MKRLWQKMSGAAVSAPLICLRRPIMTLLLAAVITLAALPGLLRLQLRTDGQALVPEAAPSVLVDRQIRELFDARDPIAVVLRSDHEHGIWNVSTLRWVHELTAAFRALDGVRAIDVVSLATEPNFRVRPGTLRFRNLLEPLPTNSSAVSQIRDDFERIQLYNGILVSRDASATAILIGTPPEADRRALIREIHHRVSKKQLSDQVEVLGAPVAESLLGIHLLADLGVPVWLDGARRADGRAAIAMVPVAVVLMGFLFLAAFRRPAAALLPLTEIGICLTIVFGTMGWLGAPIYLTIAVMPVILTAIGVADEVHIFRRYLDLGPTPDMSASDHRDIVQRTLVEMTPPVVQTSLTTIVAFLAFALSPLPAVRAFGLFTAFGVLLCMVYSLTVVPALLVLLGPKPWIATRSRAGSRWAGSRWAGSRWAGSRWTGSRWTGSRWTGSLARSLAGLAFRRRRWVLGSALLITLFCLSGARRLTVQDSWVDGFAPNSSFAQTTRWFDDQFLGSHLLRLEVAVEAPSLDGQVAETSLGRFELTIVAPEDFDPVRLKEARLRIFELASKDLDRDPREWQTWCESVRQEGDRLIITMPRRWGSARLWLRPEPGDSVGYELKSEPLSSPTTLQHLAGFETFLATRPGVGGVLGPVRYLKTVAFMLRSDDPESRQLPKDPSAAGHLWSNYGRIRGEEQLSRLVDKDRSRALMTLYLEDSSYADTQRLMQQIRQFEAQSLERHGINIRFAGDVAVSQATIDAVVTTQVRSLWLSLLGIFGAAAWLSRSWRKGIYCLIPPAFAVLVSFAAMGWMSIPLGVATSMFAGMTLGVGVDFAIHTLADHDRARTKALSREDALSAALTHTGPAIAINACALILGFSVLMLSEVPANARLGGLLVSSVLACLLATVFGVPAMLAREKS